MCQIIAISSKKAQILKEDLIYHRETFTNLLKEKGEDYFSCGILSKSNVSGKLKPINFVMSLDNVDILFDKITDILNENTLKDSNQTGIILFSRQKPEMERMTMETQPYVIGDGMVAIHGTIINDQELASKYNFTAGIDTEVFKYLDIASEEIRGTFAAIKIDKNIDIITRDNGLKLWRSNLLESETSIVSTGNLDFLFDYDERIYPGLERNQNTHILFASFSGGMDIALSTYKALSTGHYKKAILNYFDWGSNAAQEEIKTLEKFRDFYSFAFPTSEIDINIIDASGYFKEFFDIAGITSKISDTNAVGDSAETESPIAYVPYRNSQFAILLSSIAEGQDLKNVDILFGLNLSEGMVFTDNSEGWLNAISETIKYGGKEFSTVGTYKVIAPYFPRTKTNMLKEFKEEFPETIDKLLELSYSCYYPKPDGSACGKCGSCILRAKAEKIALREQT